MAEEEIYHSKNGKANATKTTKTMVRGSRIAAMVVIS